MPQVPAASFHAFPFYSGSFANGLCPFAYDGHHRCRRHHAHQQGQTCSDHGTKLPGITLTLDNTRGQSPVAWQVHITQTDVSRNLWATSMPQQGMVPAGKTAVLWVNPEKQLCHQQPTTTFPATITYQSPSGSGTISFTDVVTSNDTP